MLRTVLRRPELCAEYRETLRRFTRRGCALHGAGGSAVKNLPIPYSLKITVEKIRTNADAHHKSLNSP